MPIQKLLVFVQGVRGLGAQGYRVLVRDTGLFSSMGKVGANGVGSGYGRLTCGKLAAAMAVPGVSTGAICGAEIAVTVRVGKTLCKRKAPTKKPNTSANKVAAPSREKTVTYTG